jgi:Transport and Golgi organisation 2
VCTVVLSLQPAARMPLLLLGFRDELTGRPWQPPARHWPGSPLVGGRDEQAGGTWLAVHPHIPRVACILNARGPQAPPGTRRSRGELPLRAAADGQQALRQLHEDHDTLAHYDPFFLICADQSHALMLSWDGSHAGLENLEPNHTHIITNAGHTYPPGAQGPDAPAAAGGQDSKAEHFGAKFAAHRPDADPTATIKDAWGDWLTLAGGDGLSDTDPAAIVVRHELPDGRVYGTTSVSLVALGPHGLRYDFQPVPADPTTWYSVDLGLNRRTPSFLFRTERGITCRCRFSPPWPGHAASALSTSATGRRAPIRAGMAVSTAMTSSVTTTVTTSHRAGGIVVAPPFFAAS